MADPDPVTAAVAAHVLEAGDARRDLLVSLATLARTLLDAGSASIAVLDESGTDLVFEAVVGNDQEDLAGARFPATAGIAGAVLASGESLCIDDLARDPRFADNVAAETGYMPESIVVAPIVRGGATAGVVSVLDRGANREHAADIALAEAVATHVTQVLDLTEAARRAAALVRSRPDHGDAGLAAIARRMDALAPERRAAAERVLAALADVL